MHFLCQLCKPPSRGSIGRRNFRLSRHRVGKWIMEVIFATREEVVVAVRRSGRYFLQDRRRSLV